MRPATRFVAAYSGYCRNCGDRIEPGDEAGYVDDDLNCQQCCDDYDAELT